MKKFLILILFATCLDVSRAKDCSTKNLQSLYSESELETALQKSAEILSCTTSQADVFQTIGLLQENLERYPGDTYYIQINLLKQGSSTKQDVLQILDLLGKLRVEHDYFYKPKEAIKELEQVAREKEGRFSCYAHFELGSQKVDKESVYWFERFLEECKDSSPDFSLVLALMAKGAEELRLGSFPKAIESYELALSDYPNATLNPEGPLEPWVRHGLASAYQLSGQKQLAIEQLQLIQKMDHYPAQESVKLELDMLLEGSE